MGFSFRHILTDSRRSRAQRVLLNDSRSLIISSAHSKEHEGARLPRIAWDFSRRISALEARSDFKLMFSTACRMLALMACSEGPRPFLCFDGERMILVSNSRILKKGPFFRFLRKQMTESSSETWNCIFSKQFQSTVKVEVWMM